MKNIILQPILKINGIINLPGSKSISNRVLLLAALSNGTTIINNLSYSDDTNYMLNALRKLGVNYILSNNNTRCKVVGNCNAFYYKNKLRNLFIGNAGTVMRSLTAVLCLGQGNISLTCGLNMENRPIGHLIDALRQGGAKIDFIKKENYPPLLLKGGFIGGCIDLNCNISSQFLTALLLIAPLAIKDTIIKIKGTLVSKPYVDITLKLMNIFGVNVINQFYKKFIIQSKQQYCSPTNYLIEGDATSASYFLAAAAIKGGSVTVTGVGRNSIQGDIYFAHILEKMLAIIDWGDNYITCTRNKLISIDMDMNSITDAAMTVAIVALFAKGTTILRNIYNWRFKETDRLSAMTNELRKLGAQVKEGKDYICITPPSVFRFAKINTYNDHRMAMSFSLVALSDTSVIITNPECTNKSFPNYFDQLSKISIIK